MSKKQWGHGFHTGKNEARNKARIAKKTIRKEGLNHFELIHIMMNEHPDKKLVNQLHSAILKSDLQEKYSKTAWLMFDTGDFEEQRPKDPEKLLSALKNLGDALAT